MAPQSLASRLNSVLELGWDGSHRSQATCSRSATSLSAAAVAALNCCKCLPVLSERRRRFPQVLPDDEGGLRRETHRTAIGGDTGEYRQAVVAGQCRGCAEDA